MNILHQPLIFCLQSFNDYFFHLLKKKMIKAISTIKISACNLIELTFESALRDVFLPLVFFAKDNLKK